LKQGIKSLEKIKFGAEKVFVFFTCVTVFSLPFGIDIAKFAIFMWFLSWFYLVISNNFKIKLVLNKEQKVLFFSLFAFLILHIFGLLYTQNFHNASKVISVKLYLLLIPIVLITGNEFLKDRAKTILNFFVFGNIVSYLFMFIRAFYRSLIFVDGHWFFNASINPDYSFFDSISFFGNYFFYSNFAYFLHPSYTSLFMLFAIVIVAFQYNIYQKNKTFISEIFSNKIFRLVVILFMSSAIFLYSSKANILALLIMFFTILIFSNIKYKYWFLFLMIIFSVFLLSRNGRFSIYLKYLSQVNTSVVVKPGTERIYIWDAAFELMKNNFVFGVGTGDVDDEFSNLIDDVNIKQFNNVHNEFLEAFVRLGIFGGEVLLFMFLFGFWLAFKNRNFVLFVFLMIVAINFSFESMLDRVAGTMFFGFFYVFLSLLKQSNTVKKQKIKEVIIILSKLLLFFVLFIYFALFFRKGLLLNVFELNFSKNFFGISAFVINIWVFVFYIPNLYWMKLFHVFILSLTFTLLYSELSNKFKNHKVYLWIGVFCLAFLISIFNLIYINSLLFLLLFLVVNYFIKYLSIHKSKKYIIVVFVSILLIVIVLCETSFGKASLFKINKYVFTSNNELIVSPKLSLLGVTDYNTNIANFEELLDFIDDENLINFECKTNIVAVSYIRKIKYENDLELNISTDSLFLILYNDGQLIDDVLFKNDDFIVAKKTAE